MITILLCVCSFLFLSKLLPLIDSVFKIFYLQSKKMNTTNLNRKYNYREQNIILLSSQSQSHQKTENFNILVLHNQNTTADWKVNYQASSGWYITRLKRLFFLLKI